VNKIDLGGPISLIHISNYNRYCKIYPYFGFILAKTMSRKSIHVVPNTKSKGYAIKNTGAERASKLVKTQKEAIIIATEKAKMEATKTKGVEVVIHRANGEIREKNTYGRDSERSKG
jgi:competence protein ComGC